MALGIFTIGPDVPAVRELFKDGKHIKLIDQDGRNFEDVVTDIMQSEEDRGAIGESGKQYVLENFTWKKNARRMLEALQVTPALQ